MGVWEYVRKEGLVQPPSRGGRRERQDADMYGTNWNGQRSEVRSQRSEVRGQRSERIAKRTPHSELRIPHCSDGIPVRCASSLPAFESSSLPPCAKRTQRGSDLSQSTQGAQETVYGSMRGMNSGLPDRVARVKLAFDRVFEDGQARPNETPYEMDSGRHCSSATSHPSNLPSFHPSILPSSHPPCRETNSAQRRHRNTKHPENA